MTVKELKRGVIEMSIINRCYYVRLSCISSDRIFTDKFLMRLSYYIENREDKEKYLDILNTEFRGEIPEKFIEELLK